jgi:hypothetical protein
MNFDLNINNYTRDELINMFELPLNFDKNILEIKEAKLKDSIINKKKTIYDSLYTVTNQYKVRYDERLNMRIPIAEDNSGWEFATKMVLVGVILLQFFTIKR